MCPRGLNKGGHSRDVSPGFEQGSDVSPAIEGVGVRMCGVCVPWRDVRLNKGLVCPQMLWTGYSGGDLDVGSEKTLFSRGSSLSPLEPLQGCIPRR